MQVQKELIARFQSSVGREKVEAEARRTDREEASRQRRQRGHDEGVRWATDVAEVRGLREIERLSKSTHVSKNILLDLFVQRAVGKKDYDRKNYDLDFAEGFRDGALEVWLAVKDQLQESAAT